MYKSVHYVHVCDTTYEHACVYMHACVWVHQRPVDLLLHIYVHVLLHVDVFLRVSSLASEIKYQMSWLIY